MKSSTRKEMILDLLRNYSHFVTVEQLSEQLFVSGATIRRDLQELADSGLIQRTRGGAILTESISTEAPMVLRESRNEMQKQIIATISKNHIKEGMTLFMDSSTTVFMLARNIDRFGNLRIITNNLKIIWLLSERKGIDIICTGGTLRESSLSFFGENALKYAAEMNADAAFLSCQGFSVTNGSSDAREEESYLKREFLANSKNRYLLFDTSKMDKEYLFRTAPANAFTKIITESNDVNNYIESTVAK
ncbi:MAG: DeoR/GlpR family DNA-binding transcription regulator [Clostridiales Family XIII bacterium]|jgi:DeoR/GlpR family transcriptional regulator of sugar metabolism|nr:DeoR/GlpR family DNA-binding transcription regulator [Clostridiales Family XIII bacterium]